MSVIKLSHGSGGVETSEIVEKLFIAKLGETLKKVPGGLGLDFPDDAAAIPIGDGQYLVVSVDSYTVSPPFFPGGDIGVLAASGSINDILMLGGRPIAMLDAVVVEEGLPMDTLEKIVNSFLSVLKSEGVALIGGDFKVMPKGQLDKVIITTVGIGIADQIIVDKPRPGDKIIVTDYVGDHGAVIMMLQYGENPGALKSDVKPLTSLMIPLLEKYGRYIHAARDPTRGGLSMVLNDWAKTGGGVIVIEEDLIPIRPEVASYANMLGVDPFHLASEGVAVLAVDPMVAEEVLKLIHSIGFINARIIGEFKESQRYKGYVLLKTQAGGYRILEPPRGDIVPRIC